MSLPGLADCLALMDEYGMLDNIRHHSLVVARLAGRLLDGLAVVAPEHSQPAPRLVITGALLHDIAKTPCLHTACNHAKAGAEICLRHGFAEIAPIVADHVLLRDFDPGRYTNGVFNATELVYYADKRVRHHSVVSLDERLDYILEHYGGDNPARCQMIRENFSRCRILEENLFRWLPFAAEDLGI